jgi:indole-3-glycerol phosphate synthase
MTTDTLSAILAAKRAALAQRKARTPIEAVRALASMQRRPQPILSTVTEEGGTFLIGLIQRGTRAEPTYDPVSQAIRYGREGLDAINLFTDTAIYDGGLNDLAAAARAARLPIISQDYIVDEYQVVEARAAGASALVLRAGIVDESTLRALISATQRNRMTPIVHIRDQAELNYALTLAPQVISLGDDAAEGAFSDARGMWASLRACIPRPTRVLLGAPIHTLDAAAAARALHIDAVMVEDGLLRQPGIAPRLRQTLDG